MVYFLDLCQQIILYYQRLDSRNAFESYLEELAEISRDLESQIAFFKASDNAELIAETSHNQIHRKFFFKKFLLNL